MSASHPSTSALRARYRLLIALLCAIIAGVLGWAIWETVAGGGGPGSGQGITANLSAARAVVVPSASRAYTVAAPPCSSGAAGSQANDTVTVPKGNGPRTVIVPGCTSTARGATGNGSIGGSSGAIVLSGRGGRLAADSDAVFVLAPNTGFNQQGDPLFVGAVRKGAGSSPQSRQAVNTGGATAQLMAVRNRARGIVDVLVVPKTVTAGTIIVPRCTGTASGARSHRVTFLQSSGSSGNMTAPRCATSGK